MFFVVYPNHLQMESGTTTILLILDLGTTRNKHARLALATVLTFLEKNIISLRELGAPSQQDESESGVFVLYPIGIERVLRHSISPVA